MEDVFDVAIFDEATELKNELTKAFISFSAIDIKFKIALTGTPIMNRLHELFNIMDFIIPKFLGDYKTFYKTYEKPIAAA